MHEFHLPDNVYELATRAAAANHVSVEDFIIEAVQLHVQDGGATYDHLFTPEVIAELDMAAEEARNGHSFSGKQVDDYLGEIKAAWQANHPS